MKSWIISGSDRIILFKVNSFKLTTNLNLKSGLSKLSSSKQDSISAILNYIEILYSLDKVESRLINFEEYFYKKIIEELSNCFSDSNNSELESQISSISSGIYDLKTISFADEKVGDTALLLGKVFSPEHGNKRMFTGAFGFTNVECNKLLNEFDRQTELIYSEIPFINRHASDFVKNKSEIKCLDIVGFAGDFNKPHKPISVFYSGKSSEELSALSKVLVFTNIYFSRFQVISRQLGMRFIVGFNEIETVNAAVINKILLFWLRGHDLGHFFGEDTLGDSMKKNRKLYYILHEFKSDIVALYILKECCFELFGVGKKRIIYLVFLSEMLRYIRRGSFTLFADSGAALLTYYYFKSKGVINYDDKKCFLKVDFDKFDLEIDILSQFLFEIFNEGKFDKALEFSEKINEAEKLEEISMLKDASIPYYLNVD